MQFRAPVSGLIRDALASGIIDAPASGTIDARASGTIDAPASGCARDLGLLLLRLSRP